MRVLDLKSAAFRRALVALAPRGSAGYAAVIGVLRQLADEGTPLVGPEDRAVAIPMSVPARSVPGTDLCVLFVPGGEVVHVIGLVRRAAP
jgi:hypothetical protein